MLKLKNKSEKIVAEKEHNIHIFISLAGVVPWVILMKTLQLYLPLSAPPILSFVYRLYTKVFSLFPPQCIKHFEMLIIPFTFIKIQIAE